MLTNIMINETNDDTCDINSTVLDLLYCLKILNCPKNFNRFCDWKVFKHMYAHFSFINSRENMTRCQIALILEIFDGYPNYRLIRRCDIFVVQFCLPSGSKRYRVVLSLVNKLPCWSNTCNFNSFPLVGTVVSTKKKLTKQTLPTSHSLCNLLSIYSKACSESSVNTVEYDVVMELILVRGQTLVLCLSLSLTSCPLFIFQTMYWKTKSRKSKEIRTLPFIFYFF